jgi:uncharacterized UBP type Zn finger protein
MKCTHESGCSVTDPVRTSMILNLVNADLNGYTVINLQDLWLCMVYGCGSIGCGRMQKKHAVRHADIKRHRLVLKVNTLDRKCLVYYTLRIDSR